jgi:hypothetical protein
VIIHNHEKRSCRSPYKFKILEDYVYPETGWILTTEFQSEWLHITTDGVIRVKANKTGYAWDGCTPKTSLLDLIIIGVPDGHMGFFV